MVTDGSMLRGEIYLTQLDPTRASEIQKTRPCLVVSPDELNQYVCTVVVAPGAIGRVASGGSSRGASRSVAREPQRQYGHCIAHEGEEPKGARRASQERISLEDCY